MRSLKTFRWLGLPAPISNGKMIDSNRDKTADMQDSYISYNSNRMNTIMKTLTVITTIFMS
jgi:Mg2+ and Co2+ transporter CorA